MHFVLEDSAFLGGTASLHGMLDLLDAFIERVVFIERYRLLLPSLVPAVVAVIFGVNGRCWDLGECQLPPAPALVLN